MSFHGRHHLTLAVWILLVLLFLLAVVSGLLDGGDFVGQHGGQRTVARQEDSTDSRAVCPAVTLESLLYEESVCSVELKENFLGGNQEELTHNVKAVESIEVKNEILPPVEKAKDPPGLTPVKVPPLIVKATPKEMTSSTTVSPLKEISEKQEIETKQQTEPETAESEPKDDAVAEFERKESAVEEEPVQEQPDVIAPFSQWAEKKLEEAAIKEPEIELSSGSSPKISSNNNNGKSNGVFKTSKNFASPDCSAKIVGANSGSQGSGNVITSSRDEYFLNKCTDKSWFIVELCDSIKALKIQLANFELYSSSPNQFKVSLANVFPGRDKDWVEFGTFSYEDERTTQTFVNDVGVVGKFVKVEVLSHHGAEHYCPVSLFKVFGIPEMDLLSEDGNDEDGSDESPEMSSEDEPKNHPIVQTIKDAVHKVVNVFRPQNVSIVETLNTSSLQGASLRFRLRPESGDKYDQSVINRYHMIYFLLATQYTRVKEYSRIINLHRALPLVCPEFGIEFPPEEGDQPAVYPWQFLNFVKLYHGEDFLVAMCNLESMEQGHSRLVRPVAVSSSQNNISNATSVVRIPADNQTEATTKTTDSDSKKQLDIVQKDVSSENKTTGIIEDNTEAVVEAASETKGGQAAPAQEQTNKPPETRQTGTSSSSAAGQTTWQKISNRLKALERNVTLSTGFLEELSLKYIKQIEELNTAVKAANEAVQGIQKREEVSRDRTERLEAQVQFLAESVTGLEGRLLELQDELLARHGLLILGEVLVIGLVLMLCRPQQGKRRQTSVSLSQEGLADSRRRSLDTMRDDRQKGAARLETRRRSFEVGCLGNGQLGSMVQQADSGLVLTKKQKKRKRRKDSKNLTTGLRHLTEEMESDNSNPQDVGAGCELDTREFLQPGSDNLAMQSTPRKEPPVLLVPGNGVQDLNGWRSKEIKTVRFPPSKLLSSSQARGCGLPPTQVSNIFSMLDNSSACDTETEEKKTNLRVSGLNKQKFIRSKSSSPNRQENLLKRQREAIRSFQPDQAEWLQRKSDF